MNTTENAPLTPAELALVASPFIDLVASSLMAGVSLMDATPDDIDGIPLDYLQLAQRLVAAGLA